MEASPRRRLARSSSSSKPPPPPARDEYGPEPEPEPEVRYDEEEGSADGARPYTAIEEEAAEDGEGAAMPGLASNGAGLKTTVAGLSSVYSISCEMVGHFNFFDSRF